jgi:flagellar biosynthesis GTPase FlhF
MPKCINCGRKAVITEHWACQWCGYPLVSRPYAKARARQQAQEAKRTKEQEEKAKKLAEEAEKRTRKEAEQQAKEQTKQQAQEAKRTKEQEEKVKKLAEEAEKIVQDIGAEVYEGEFQLVLPLDVSSKQVKQFEEYLRKVEDLMILSTGWSSDEGSIISVSLQKSLNLLHFFNEMPTVEKVYKKGRKIIITLKTLLDNSGDH